MKSKDMDMDKLIDAGREYEKRWIGPEPGTTATAPYADTESIKAIISHAAQSRVKCLDLKGIGLFVEFYERGQEQEKKEEPLQDTDDDEQAPGGISRKEYLGAGIVSKEDADTLMNPLWKE